MARRLILKDIKIFDGQEVISNGHIIVDPQGLIEHVGPGHPIDDADSTVISKPGHTLLPGLIDGHIHADNANEIALPQSLRFGVTTVCDMGNESHYIRKLFDQIKTQGDGICADIKTTQYAATVDGGWPVFVILAHDKSPETREALDKWPKLVSPEDGRKYVNEMMSREGGMDYVKLMHESGQNMGLKLPMPSIELQRAIVDEAHRHGLKAIAHATCLADTLAILQAGADGTTHTVADAPVNDEVIAAYKQNNAHCNPTLATIGSLTAEGLAMQKQYVEDPRVQPLLTEPSRASMHDCLGFYKGNKDNTVDNAYESVKLLHKAGVEIICGSDAAGPTRGTAWGVSVHHELALFVKHCDFTPVEALRAGTYATAKCFNMHDRGSLRPGKRADLLLVEGDPTVNIDDTLNIRGVWKMGVPAEAHTIE